MKLSHVAIVLALLMSGVSIASTIVRPKARAADHGNVLVLETAVPVSFGEWTVLPDQTAQVVNPQVKEGLDKIYSQIVSRTYINKAGYRIMLSLAYGGDQRGGLQTHRPEVCYPGQGFRIGSIQDGSLLTSFGGIDVRRLTTSLGARNEPVTYWLTVGDKVVNSRFDKRVAEIRLALTGQIPDGMLFRVSSIDNDPARAFAAQQKFAADMLSFVPGNVRKQLSGLSLAGSAS